MKRTEILEDIARTINRKMVPAMVDSIYEHEDNGWDYISIHVRWYGYTIEASVEGDTKDIVFMKGGALLDLPNIAEAVGKKVVTFDDDDVRSDYEEKIKDEYAWEETMAYLNRTR